MLDKEFYEDLELEVIRFDAADVITTSGEAPDPDDPYETPIL